MRLLYFIVLLIAALPPAAAQLAVHPLPRATIEDRLRQLSRDNATRKARLQQLFTEAGCPQLTEQSVKKSKLPNVLCTVPGLTDSTIIVGAHFDHVDIGDGAVDNWTGAALLPSLFQSIAHSDHRHTYVFIGFTNEESGLWGSDYYASRLSPEQRTKIDAMLNIDSLGLSPTKVWVSHSDARLVRGLDSLAEMLKLPLASVNVEKVGTGDSESFRKYQVPTITIHSVTQETLPILHSAKDRLDAVKLDDYYDSYRLLAAYVAMLDEFRKTPPAEPAKAD